MAQVVSSGIMSQIFQPFERSPDTQAAFTYQPRGVVRIRGTASVLAQGAGDHTVLQFVSTLPDNFCYRLLGGQLGISQDAASIPSAFLDDGVMYMDDSDPDQERTRRYVGLMATGETEDAVGLGTKSYHFADVRQVFRSPAQGSIQLQVQLTQVLGAAEPAATARLNLDFLFYDLEQYTKVVMHTVLPVAT